MSKMWKYVLVKFMNAFKIFSIFLGVCWKMDQQSSRRDREEVGIGGRNVEGYEEAEYR